jgi:hypothetical protein
MFGCIKKDLEVLEIGLRRFFMLRCNFCTFSFQRHKWRSNEVVAESPESPGQSCVRTLFKRANPREPCSQLRSQLVQTRLSKFVKLGFFKGKRLFKA